MAFGTAAYGLAAGVAMANSDLGTPLAIYMSVFAYVGTAQIAVLPLIAEKAPIWVILLTTACICLRFSVFGHYFQPYFAHLPRRQRMVLAYLVGDTSLLTFMQRYRGNARVPGQITFFLGSALLTYVVWQVASIVGIVVGNVIPAAWDLGFAGTLALLALTFAQLTSRSLWLAGAAAACTAIAVRELPLRLNVLAAICVAVAIGGLLDALRSKTAVAE